MAEYPLVIRNNVAIYLRCFMLAFLIVVAVITHMALRDGPAEPEKWWPLALLGFWACALFGIIHAMNQESSVVRISSPGRIHVSRGKAFRREEHWVGRGRFWIEDTKDSDGDPYFKLMMDAPGGKLAIKEGYSRARLEVLQQSVEAAASGH